MHNLNQLETGPKPEVPIRKGTLFVTGGSHGIGEDILRLLAPRYPAAFNFDHDSPEQFDVRDHAALEQAFNETLSPTTQNDLVIAAGVFVPKDFLEQTSAEVTFVLDTNITGALLTSQAFLRWHEQRQHPIKPNIVIISSISAFYPGGKTNVVYDATKAALSNMVKNLANYCAVNAVEPGTIRGTEIGAWKPDFSKDESSKAIVDHGQEGDVESCGIEILKSDISDVVEQLLFRNPRGAINGTTIKVDGGMTARRSRFCSSEE